MKKILMALILLGMASFAVAQAVKLGYVDTDRVLYESNELREIERLFNLDQQNWRTQIRNLDAEIKQMEQDFEIDKLTKNEAAKREAQARIDEKKAEAGRMLQEYFGEGGKAEQRYRELVEPLTVKINEIIRKIAESEKYTMIFDSSYPVVIYAIPSLDLTDIVIQDMNKDTIAPTEGDTGTTTQLPPDSETKPGDNPEVKPEDIKP